MGNPVDAGRAFAEAYSAARRDSVAEKQFEDERRQREIALGLTVFQAAQQLIQQGYEPEGVSNWLKQVSPQGHALFSADPLVQRALQVSGIGGQAQQRQAPILNQMPPRGVGPAQFAPDESRQAPEAFADPSLPPGARARAAKSFQTLNLEQARLATSEKLAAGQELTPEEWSLLLEPQHGQVAVGARSQRLAERAQGFDEQTFDRRMKVQERQVGADERRVALAERAQTFEESTFGKRFGLEERKVAGDERRVALAERAQQFEEDNLFRGTVSRIVPGLVQSGASGSQINDVLRVIREGGELDPRLFPDLAPDTTKQASQMANQINQARTRMRAAVDDLSRAMQEEVMGAANKNVDKDALRAVADVRYSQGNQALLSAIGELFASEHGVNQLLGTGDPLFMSDESGSPVIVNGELMLTPHGQNLIQQAANSITVRAKDGRALTLAEAAGRKTELHPQLAPVVAPIGSTGFSVIYDPLKGKISVVLSAHAEDVKAARAKAGAPDGPDTDEPPTPPPVLLEQPKGKALSEGGTGKFRKPHEVTVERLESQIASMIGKSVDELRVFVSNIFEHGRGEIPLYAVMGDMLVHLLEKRIGRRVAADGTPRKMIETYVEAVMKVLEDEDRRGRKVGLFKERSGYRLSTDEQPAPAAKPAPATKPRRNVLDMFPGGA